MEQQNQNQKPQQNNQQSSSQNQNRQNQNPNPKHLPTKTIVARAIENVQKKAHIQQKLNFPINQHKQQPQFRPMQRQSRPQQNFQQKPFHQAPQPNKLTITLKPTHHFQKPNQNPQKVQQKPHQQNQMPQQRPQQQTSFQQKQQPRKPESAVSIREEIRRMIREELARQKR